MEAIGPFTLFVNRRGGWPFYARPTPGATAFETSDVEDVRERQRELRVPEAIEWVEELAPTLGELAVSTGLELHRHPLMHLAPEDFRPMRAPDGVRVRAVSAEDDLATTDAIAKVAFSNPGTDVGTVDDAALPTVVAGPEPWPLAFVRERVMRGHTVTVVAELDGRPAAVGSHNPVGEATEIVGVGTLPAFRRRGLGGAVSSVLVEDALDRGISLVLLSAGDDTVARVYARLGFRVVGSAGSAEAPNP